MSFIHLLKQEWFYANPKDRLKLIFVLFFHILSNLGLIVSPLILKQLINTIANSNRTLDQIFFWLSMMFVCFFLFEVFHRVARLIEIPMGGRIRENFVDALYKKVYNLPFRWHLDNHSGDTINRVRLASESLFEFTGWKFEFIATMILAVGPFISITIIAYDVAIMLLVMIIITVLINHKFDKILVKVIQEKNEKIHKFTATLFDFISNIETLITLGIGRQTEKVLKSRSRIVSEGHISENRFNQIKCFVISILGFIMEAGIMGYFIVTRFEQLEIVTVGTVVLVHQYCVMVKNSTGTFSGIFFQLVGWSANISSADSIVNSETYRDEFFGDSKDKWNNLTIKNIKFCYQGAESKKNNILSDFQLDASKHQKIALTGQSGSGKSTLFKLIRGLYIPEKVELGIDGYKFQNFAPLASSVTLIPQNQEIFENTILYNITLDSEYDDIFLNKVLDVSGVSSILKRLKNGIESDIRENGVNLSGGEKQRIALARGLMSAKESSILLMDEVTSNIDMELEEKIYKGIFELYPDKLIIASIHRLHLINMFDKRIKVI